MIESSTPHLTIKRSTDLANLPGGLLPYKRLMGMCRWMGSHFHDWIDYNEVAFSIELLKWGRSFPDFLGKTVLHIYR